VHTHCGNGQALETAVKMADWIKFRVDRLTSAQVQASLETEFGGMNEVLANLYALTGNPDHLRLARAFDHARIFDPLARGQDQLDGLHANTQVPKMIGAAREYELTGEKRYRDIAAFFWERVALHRSYVIGGHSDSEHFFPVDQFSRHLGPDTAETCNTYNMLKLTRHLFAWEPSAQVADFYERALFNHILASQEPQQGMFVYLMSLKPGHFKTYSTPENSFWCCVGTGMENHAKYGDSIYYRNDSSLYVNLFLASELTWKEKGLRLRQETRFPEEGLSTLRLSLEHPQPLALRIRCPYWIEPGSFRVTINGEKLPLESKPSSYVTLQREWRDGDAIRVEFTMRLRTEKLPGDPNTITFLYGPIVLAGELGTQGMPSPYARNQTDLHRVPSPEVPALVADSGEWPRHIQPVAGRPLTFRTRGIGRPRDVTLVPFYALHHQRYTVYWKTYTETGWKQHAAERAAAEAARQELERRTIDLVGIGEQQSETDHRLLSQDSQSGGFYGRKWRHTGPGGWFSYELKTAPDQPVTLVCTYWGDERGERQFDVLVDGQKIATQTLGRVRPGEFYDQEYRIPLEQTRGKERINLKFQAHPGKIAGGLFGLRIIRTE
jgi:DUF1680 family protein